MSPINKSKIYDPVSSDHLCIINPIMCNFEVHQKGCCSAVALQEVKQGQQLEYEKTLLNILYYFTTMEKIILMYIYVNNLHRCG